MRAIILILDSLGIGAAPDADKFNDCGANTLGHIAEHCQQGLAEQGRSGPLNIPHLESMGLALASQMASGSIPAGCNPNIQPLAAWGAASEISTGKDTPSGHWELAGVPVLSDWGYFHDKQNSFPAEFLTQLIEAAALPGSLGNCHASGTEIIQRLGEEHCRTGKPIFYTSGDSVFQIAVHEEHFGLERLYQLCEIAFAALRPYNICRVIARPFNGHDAASFARTGNRRDYAVSPPAPTLLDQLYQAGGTVISVGKIADIFAHQGINRKVKASGLDAIWDATLKAVDDAPDFSIVMSNFVDFDEKYGHRRDICGYARALEAFDLRLPELLARLAPDDVLVLSADHGCDPSWPGTEHTREYVPALVYGARIPARSLGLRSSFADIGQSLALAFGLPGFEYGTSFIPECLQHSNTR